MDADGWSARDIWRYNDYHQTSINKFNSVDPDFRGKSHRAHLWLQDPEILAEARSRFDSDTVEAEDNSPPSPLDQASTLSPCSRLSSRSASPAPAEDVDPQKYKDKLERQCMRSRPMEMHRFLAMVEVHRNDGASLRRRPYRPEVYRKYRKMVSKRWKEQGIWGPEWKRSKLAHEPWHHVKQFEPKLWITTPGHFHHPQRPPPPPSGGYPASDEEPEPEKEAREDPKVVEKRRLEIFVRERSRPLYVFMMQVMDETSESVRQGKVGGEATGGTDIDNINSAAYDVVRDRWVQRGIWDNNWGLLPGQRWKHEHMQETIEEGMAEKFGPDWNKAEEEARGKRFEDYDGREAENEEQHDSGVNDEFLGEWNGEIIPAGPESSVPASDTLASQDCTDGTMNEGR